MNGAHPDATASCAMCGSTELKPAERLPAGCWRCLNCRAVFRAVETPAGRVEQRALVDRLIEINAWPVQMPTVEELQTLLSLLLEVVHAGGKLTLLGTGPLSDPGRIGYDATLTSHTGARHSAAHGDDLQQCLEQLCTRWGKQ